MYSACMVALQIRDVPDEVRDALVAAARARGQSLQAYLLALLEREAGYARNLAILREAEGRTDGSRLTAAEARQLIDEARAERDSHHDPDAGEKGHSTP
ncbi:FitA-like ribbon-helix-helix domain-containing protein [Actinopolymorpha alba]|uniref:FitA-like ribbon-helix-helix domain-containing protein n=1 Tax=Actinopolymorpha alba TaxID=533267 RepID=UPI00192AC042|nr:hypothetical protein [Actinopolymorpha alba]